MNDIQILTLALTVGVTFIGVFLGVLINNNRLNDVKELLRAEIHAEGAQTKLLLAELRVLMEKQHSEIDSRLSRLEAQRLIQ